MVTIERAGIELFLSSTMIYYSKPMHLQKAFENVKMFHQCFDNTEKLTELQRPVGQHQTHQQMHNVNPGRNIDENILSNILAIESQQQIDG